MRSRWAKSTRPCLRGREDDRDVLRYISYPSTYTYIILLVALASINLVINGRRFTMSPLRLSEDMLMSFLQPARLLVSMHIHHRLTTHRIQWRLLSPADFRIK